MYLHLFGWYFSWTCVNSRQKVIILLNWTKLASQSITLELGFRFSHLSLYSVTPVPHASCKHCVSRGMEISGGVGLMGNGDSWGLIFFHQSSWGFMGINPHED